MSSFIIPILILIGVLVAGTLIFIFSRSASGGSKEERGKAKPRHKDRAAILKTASRRLAQNPKDPQAHQNLAELYFHEEDYENALKHYGILLELCASHPELKEFDITLKHALAAMKVKNYDLAHKSLVLARTLDENSFEVNLNLGDLEYMRKNYQKAIPILQKALALNPSHLEANRAVGMSFHRIKKYKESIPYLRRALEIEPQDKTTLFTLGQSALENGQNDSALKIFSHLRTDPEIGATASLYSGTLHFKNKNYQKAITDFEIGLRHENLSRELLLEFKYRLAATYMSQEDLGAAIRLWREIQNLQPDYKDVRQQLQKYQEINTNTHLQTFLMASMADFVTLCRRVAAGYFPGAVIKITNVSLQKSEYADILAEVHTRQWEDIVIFRFVRTSGQIGELILRELYARIKEAKAGRGICLTTGTFSEGARQFVEARLIDLVEKEALLKLFSRLAPNPEG